MKKIFILMAAMLLSVGAFAQSENNGTPLKGDVNGDGTVDVADIATIIEIMAGGGGTVTTGGYFYLGTTEPTAENYQTLPGVVTTYTSIDDAAGTSVSIAAGETLYMLCPAAWLVGKTVELEDDSENKYNFLEETDATTISGYVIYKTQVWNAPSDVVLKTKTYYYYYAGWTQPTASNVDTIINETYPADKGSSTINTAGKKTETKSTMDYLSNTLYNATAKTEYYVLVPTGHAIYDSLNNNVSGNGSTFTTVGTITVGNQTHTVYKCGASRYINAIIIK